MSSIQGVFAASSEEPSYELVVGRSAYLPTGRIGRDRRSLAFGLCTVFVGAVLSLLLVHVAGGWSYVIAPAFHGPLLVKIFAYITVLVVLPMIYFGFLPLKIASRFSRVTHNRNIIIHVGIVLFIPLLVALIDMFLVRQVVMSLWPDIASRSSIQEVNTSECILALAWGGIAGFAARRQVPVYCESCEKTCRDESPSLDEESGLKLQAAVERGDFRDLGPLVIGKDRTRYVSIAHCPSCGRALVTLNGSSVTKGLISRWLTPEQGRGLKIGQPMQDQPV